MGNLGLAGANGLTFLLCVMFFGYVVLILVPYLRHRPEAPGDDSQLRWHFLVPCLDEQEVVERTVRGLLKNFPAAHVWAVDDASADATLDILTRLANEDLRVHVIARRLPDARNGKGPALNAGWLAIERSLPAHLSRDQVIVSVVDADALLDPRALAMISGPSFFADGAVGAVQVQVRAMRDPFRDPTDQPPGPWRDRVLVKLQDMEFTGVIPAMQMVRRRVGSVAMGGNGQFTRLSVLNRIAAERGAPWHGALLEDYELGLHVLLVGAARTEYCHDTWVRQEGLPHVRSLLRQRSRWAQGSLQCTRYLSDVFRSTHLSHGGALEVAYVLFLPWLQLIGSVAWAVMVAAIWFNALTDPGGITHWIATTWGLLPLFVVFAVAPFVVWGFTYRAKFEPNLSRRQALGLGLLNVGFLVYLYQGAVWWAFFRLVTGRTDWKKTARYSGPQPGVSPAPRVLPVPLMLPVPRPAEYPSACDAVTNGAAMPGRSERVRLPTAIDRLREGSAPAGSVLAAPSTADWTAPPAPIDHFFLLGSTPPPVTNPVPEGADPHDQLATH